MESELHSRPELNRFWDALAPILGGYRCATFSYVAVKSDEGFCLSQGRFRFHVVRPDTRIWSFRSTNVRAGIAEVMTDLSSVKAFVASVLNGTIPLPEGEITFHPEPSRSHSIHFTPLHHDAEQQRRREVRLDIQGKRHTGGIDPERDWSLRAGKPPFDGILDVCNAFGAGPMRGDFANIEFVAPNIAAIAPSSCVTGTAATLGMELAAGLDPERSHLTLRVIEGKKVSNREVIDGAALLWKDLGDRQLGSIQRQVAPGAIVHCTACYRGVAYGHRWLLDHSTSSNPRRAALQPFDPDLASLSEAIRTLQGKGQKKGGFETAVSQLLWLLGFSPAHLGQTHQTQDAPDIVAFTPGGNVVLVECTTALVKTDKVSLLIERANALKKNLSESDHTYLRVLPVIVTNKSRADVAKDLADARKRGVVGIDLESLLALVSETEAIPNPDRIFHRGEEFLRSGPFEIGAPEPAIPFP
jgi:hypothetical protein